MSGRAEDIGGNLERFLQDLSHHIPLLEADLSHIKKVNVFFAEALAQGNKQKLYSILSATPIPAPPPSSSTPHPNPAIHVFAFIQLGCVYNELRSDKDIILYESDLSVFFGFFF